MRKRNRTLEVWQKTDSTNTDGIPTPPVRMKGYKHKMKHARLLLYWGCALEVKECKQSGSQSLRTSPLAGGVKWRTNTHFGQKTYRIGDSFVRFSGQGRWAERMSLSENKNADWHKSPLIWQLTSNVHKQTHTHTHTHTCARARQSRCSWLTHTNGNVTNIRFIQCKNDYFFQELIKYQ